MIDIHPSLVVSRELPIAKLPMPGEYWKRPQPKQFGHASDSPMYEMVGRLLSTWEAEVEGNLVDLFVLLVQSYSPAAKRAYGSIVSASSRREVIEGAAEMAFRIHNVAEEDRKIFRSAITHIGHAIRWRNDVAHGIVVSVESNGRNMGHFVVPAFYASKKNKRDLEDQDPSDPFFFMSGDYRFDYDDLVLFLVSFRALASAITQLYFRLRQNYPKMHQLSVPPEASIP